MDTIKTSALTLIAIIASLMLLLTPDSYQVEAPISGVLPTKQFLPALTRQNSPVGIEREQSAAEETYDSMPVAPDRPKYLATAPIAEQAVNWALILYPELARITELENQFSDAALGELTPMLSNTDPVVRLAALELLVDINHPATLPMLSAALDDPSPQIRIVALEALALQNDDAAITSIEPYLYDREPEVRIAAIEALASFENEVAVNTLAGLLTDQNRLVRHHAVNALGDIGGDYAIWYLLQARHDADETIRANAESILSELDDRSSY